jgi:hypothetical protein
MSYSTNIIPHRRLAVIELRGTVDASELRAALDALVTHPDWEPGYHVIWDGHECRLRLKSVAEVDALIGAAEAFDDRIGTGRVGIVPGPTTNRNKVKLILLRYPHSSRERRIFDTFGAALRWIQRTDKADHLSDVDLLYRMSRT